MIKNYIEKLNERIVDLDCDIRSSYAGLDDIQEYGVSIYGDVIDDVFDMEFGSLIIEKRSFVYNENEVSLSVLCHGLKKGENTFKDHYLELDKDNKDKLNTFIKALIELNRGIPALTVSTAKELYPGVCWSLVSLDFKSNNSKEEGLRFFLVPLLDNSKLLKYVNFVRQNNGLTKTAITNTILACKNNRIDLRITPISTRKFKTIEKEIWRVVSNTDELICLLNFELACEYSILKGDNL